MHFCTWPGAQNRPAAKMKIAYITYRTQQRYATGTTHDENNTLLQYLLAQGLDIENVIWNDPEADWNKYSVAVLKSPWDYHEYYAEFCAWLDKTEGLGIALYNPYHIIRWNGDKHYLQEIADSGLAVVASLFVEKDTKPHLQEYFGKLNAQQLVIKPCVSASAKHTLVVTPENVAGREAELHQLLQEDSFLIQPFMEEILNGEISLLFFAGRYSHSILKLPKPGDFRVQHFHGGTIQPYEATNELIGNAQEYVTCYAGDCLYARVDGILVNGHFQLMELELIEPYLYLSSHPDGYLHYYEALMECMGS